jgi:uncharacterized protein (DUF885 family)
MRNLLPKTILALFLIFVSVGCWDKGKTETLQFTGNQITPTVRTQPEITKSILLEDTPVVKSVKLEIDEFFQASYRELLLRDPEAVLEAGLEDVLGVVEAELTDISDSYIRETQEMHTAILERLREYDRGELTPDQQVSYDVYEWYLDDLVRGHEFMYYDYPVTHFITGVQVQLIHFFTDIHPIENIHDAENYIARLSQVDRKLNQLVQGLKLREQAGIVPPKFVIQWSLGGIRDVANGSAKSTPFYTAFQEKLSVLDEISEDEKDVLLKAAESGINESVKPGYQALAEYLEYLQSIATTDDGVWQFSQGDAYYDYVLRHHTTTDLTADRIHELGIEELDRIQAEMRQVFDDLGYPQDEDLPELFNRVAQDSGFVSGDQVVRTYETLIQEADQNLDAAFDIRPSADIIVIGGPTGGYYVPGALDGSRPGAFYATNSSSEPHFSMPTLAYHEAIPGHHFQISIAQESNLPDFRNQMIFTSYAEGWALYAERLAWEMGWYDDDPYGNLGRLQAEAFRAARLVVDTGIHRKGWTFDQAVDFMIKNTGLPPGMVNFEVSRYIAWPGQALAYKVGMLKILGLRQEAIDRLGDQFNLKEFHNVLLLNGSMPLNLLEQVVHQYIEDKLD